MEGQLAAAYRICKETVTQQYPRFPLVYTLLPKRSRHAWTTTVAFMCTQQAILNDPELSLEAKSEQLAAVEEKLKQLSCGHEPENDPLFYAMYHTLKQYPCPLEPFYTQLNAFQESVHQNRYQTQVEVLEFCQQSMAPLGHLILRLHQHSNTDTIFYSDAICAALQLAHFLRDMFTQYQDNGRIYLPMQEFKQFELPDDDFLNPRYERQLAKLVVLQVRDAYATLAAGKDMIEVLPFDLRWRTCVIIAYIENLLRQLELRGHEIQKPIHTGFWDGVRIAVRTVILLINRKEKISEEISPSS
jgi:phytoene synthase